MVIASCYGFPKGHHDRGTNEDFICAVMGMVMWSEISLFSGW